MAVMARWLSIYWQVSDRQITALENLATSKKLKKETNDDRDGGNPTNVKGFEPVPLTFDYTVSKATGADPLRHFEALKKLVGRKAPFYLGGKRFGPSRLQLDEVGMETIVLGNDGQIIVATISVSLKQDGGSGSSSGDSTPAGIGSGSGVTSAINVGPSASAKTIKLGG